MTGVSVLYRGIENRWSVVVLTLCLPPFAKAAKSGAPLVVMVESKLTSVMVESKTLVCDGVDAVPPTLRKGGEEWGTP